MDRRVLNPTPSAPGAYALILRLARDTRLDIRTLGRPVLPVGLYLYAGSARGPGGIRARVGRHLRQPKARVWHIDHLTEAARVEEVVAFPGGRECFIADFALARGAQTPVPRFGASDCRRCEAHLLAVDTDVLGALRNIARFDFSPLTAGRLLSPGTP